MILLRALGDLLVSSLAVWLSIYLMYTPYAKVHFFSCLIATAMLLNVSRVGHNGIDSIFRLATGSLIMKCWDMFMRRSQPPRLLKPVPDWKHKRDVETPQPSALWLSLRLMYEQRYVSFDISNQKLMASLRQGGFVTYLKHLLLFIVLCYAPSYSPIKALRLLDSIYLIWTCGAVVVDITIPYDRENSPPPPPLFQPLWTANSLENFWSRTWHSVFYSQIVSLGFKPAYALTKSYPIALLASFAVSGLYHVYGLSPVLGSYGSFCVFLFFIVNAIGIMVERVLFGKPSQTKHKTARLIFAWLWCLTAASWTAERMDLPENFSDFIVIVQKDYHTYFG